MGIGIRDPGRPRDTIPAYFGGNGSDYGQQFYLFDGFGAGQGDGPFGDDVGVFISSYSDNQITFTFGDAYPGYGEVNQGDTFSMTVLGTTFNGTVSYPAHTTAGPAPYAYVANFNREPSPPSAPRPTRPTPPSTVGTDPTTSPSPPTGRPPM